MELDAEYSGIDLSETMLVKGMDFMSRAGIAVDLALADATRLPYASDAFDVVVSYGAVNGFGDPGAALTEMARVTKQGGVLLFLDEQLYEDAPAIERLYFEKVLSSHDTVHRCPIDLLPESLANAVVYQVYQFYYVCVATKV
jgi:ubiquinone/menaquinone biosynthesis C-methylase UbiE